LLGLGTAAALATSCLSKEAHDDTHWGYTGEEGPSHWAELDPDYVLAALGGSQSPIDIVTEDVITADLPPVALKTQPVPLRMRNTGHTLEVIAPGGSTLRYGKHEFVLTQYHFHAPSEHTIDGQQAAAELHLVHANGAGQLAVVGVLVEEGEEDNPFFLSFVETDAPEEPGEEKVFPGVLVDIAHVFDTCHDYFMYDGSLTTPPATEGVRWFVCAEPRVISTRQLEVLRHLYFRNNRPIQPAHARTVLTPH
jgi:carbonic anhydrase